MILILSILINNKEKDKMNLEYCKITQGKNGTVQITLPCCDTSILTIDEVSDDDTINLFFIPHKNAHILESIQHEEDKTAECTHELLIERSKI